MEERAPRAEARPAGPIRFSLRTTPHHRTDVLTLRGIYAAIDELRASPALQDVGQRVEWYSCRDGNSQWLQHLEIGGIGAPEGWTLLDATARRHPGWVLRWELITDPKELKQIARARADTRDTGRVPAGSSPGATPRR